MNITGLDRFQLCTILLNHYEGFSSTAYYDTIGKMWTIGTGLTNSDMPSPIKEGDTITQAQNDTIVASKLRTSYFPQIQSKISVELSENQWGAILDYNFNRGIGNVENSGIFNAINNDPSGEKVLEILITTGTRNGSVAGLVFRRISELILYKNNDIQFFN